MKGMRFALPKEYFSDALNPEIAAAIRAAAPSAGDPGRSGGRGEPSRELEYALPAYYVISSAEASSNLARFDGVKYGFRAENVKEIHDLYKETRTQGFGAEVKRRIMLGSFVRIISTRWKSRKTKICLSLWSRRLLYRRKKLFTSC